MKDNRTRPYFAFQWHITDDCDQRCRHCYIYSNGCKKHIDSMTWEQIEDTFYNCLDFCTVHERKPYFYITGGDPILHPRFWKLLELLHAHEIPFTILGNPFHLDEKTCRRMKDLGCEKYQLSLDGLEKTHDWFRKSGSYACTIEKIKTIRDAGMKAVIMSTVSKTNVGEIPLLVDEVVKAGADIFSFSRYVPSGGELDTTLSPKAYREMLDQCDQKYKEYEREGCSTYFDRKDHLWTLYQYETGEFPIPETPLEKIIYGGCHCGNTHLTILPTGDVYACRRVQDSRIGNVLTDRLADLWQCEMEAYRQYDQFSKCSKCGLLSWCRGCPAVARGTNGSFYAPDPQCWADENSDLFAEGR